MAIIRMTGAVQVTITTWVDTTAARIRSNPTMEEVTEAGMAETAVVAMLEW